MDCPDCGFGPLTSADRFCPDCGARLPRHFCNECGAPPAGPGGPAGSILDKIVGAVLLLAVAGFFGIAWLRASGDLPADRLPGPAEIRAAVSKIDKILAGATGSGTGAVIFSKPNKFKIAGENRHDFGTVFLTEVTAVADRPGAWPRADLEKFARAEILPRAKKSPAEIFVLTLFEKKPAVATADAEGDPAFLAKFLFLDRTIWPGETIPASFAPTPDVPHLFGKFAKN